MHDKKKTVLKVLIVIAVIVVVGGGLFLLRNCNFEREVRPDVISDMDSFLKSFYATEGNYVLTCDLDFSGIEFDRPIGVSERPYAVNFDGNNHVIKNLEVNDTYSGLFGYIKGKDVITIKNLVFEDVKIKGKYCGALAGKTEYVNIENIQIKSGEIGDGTADVTGGVVGLMRYGKMKDCKNSVSVLGNSYVGGIVGETHYVSLIDSCENAADFEARGNDGVGGIIGRYYAFDGGNTIKSCKNSGNISSYGEHVGGIVGRADSGDNEGFAHRNTEIFIYYCENSGKISGKKYTGGILGGGEKHLEELAYCVNSGTIKGARYTGGIAGEAPNATFTNCKNVGEDATVTGDTYVGGISGYGKTFSSCENNSAVTAKIHDNNIVAVGGISGGARNADNCKNSGVVSSLSENINASRTGGICGYIETGDMRDCVNTGAISGMNEVGGMAGWYSINDIEMRMFKCTNEGTVTGRTPIGGLIGGAKYQSGSLEIMECENKGTIFATRSLSPAAGLLIGYASGSGAQKPEGKIAIKYCKVGGILQGQNAQEDLIVGSILYNVVKYFENTNVVTGTFKPVANQSAFYY